MEHASLLSLLFTSRSPTEILLGSGDSCNMVVNECGGVQEWEGVGGFLIVIGIDNDTVSDGVRL